MPSPKLTVLPAHLQFALVLLYSVLARNKPGMDTVVSLLFMCSLNHLAHVVPECCHPSCKCSSTSFLADYATRCCQSASSAVLPWKQPAGTAELLFAACSTACIWATTRAS
jgi:hypothetical protein